MPLLRAIRNHWALCGLCCCLGLPLWAQPVADTRLAALEGQAAAGEWEKVDGEVPALLPLLEGPVRADALTLWAQARRRLGRPDTALVLHRSAWAWRVAQCGWLSPEAARSLHNLGNDYLRLGRLDSAGHYLYRAGAILARSESDTLLAKVYNSLGVWHLYQGATDSSRYYLEQSLDRWRAVLPADSPRLLAPLSNAATLLQGVDDQQSLAFLRQAWPLAIHAPAEEQARVADNLGRTYLRVFQLDSAGLFLELAIDAYEGLPSPPVEEQANAYLALAQRWLLTSEPVLAQTIIDKALRLSVGGNTAVQVTMAQLLQARARCQLALGETAAAEEDLLAALNTLAAAPGSTGEEQAEAYTLLGTHYLEQHQWPAAEHYLQSALDRWRLTGDPAGYRQCLLALARAQAGQQNWSAASRLLAEAEGLWATTRSPAYWEVALLAAEVAMGQGQPDLARERYLAVLAATEAQDEASLLYRWPAARARLGLARLYWETTADRAAGATACLAHALPAARLFTDLIAEAEGESTTLLWRYRFNELFDLLVEAHLALGQPAEAFYWTEYSKVLTLRRLRRPDPRRALLQQRLAYWRLQLTEDRRPFPHVQASRAQVQDSIYQLSRQLAALPSDGSLREPLPLDSLQRTLAPAESIFSYYWGAEVGYGFVLRADTLAYFSLPVSPEQDQRVRRYFRLVGTSPWAWPDTVQDARLAECEALGYQLYQDLWAPAVPLLTREVILIPDGLLHYLPFPGLLRREVGDGRPQAEDYLLGRYNLRLHFSTALLGLTSVSRQSSGPDRLLGIAPTFDGDPSGLPPLYYNLREVTGLEERYRGHYLLREQGDKQAFLTRMNDYSVWHFSTHGYYDDAQPGASFLAFYHAGDRRTDNRLFAEEIAAMRIHPRLVVLSACETATGTLYRGEGLLSLARSFYQAGAPNILATRWRIDDAQSERLMTLFYEAMAEGMDSAAALREAQLAYLSESRGAALHPYYWAAFLHLGEGAEIGLRTPPSPWWWLAGVVALLVAFLIGRRSRSVRA